MGNTVRWRYMRKRLGEVGLAVWLWIGKKWRWDAILSVGAFSLIRMGEYLIGVSLLAVAALAAISKISQWSPADPKIGAAVIKKLGYAAVVACFIILVTITNNVRGDSPWSNWNDNKVTVKNVDAKVAEWLRRSPFTIQDLTDGSHYFRFRVTNTMRSPILQFEVVRNRDGGGRSLDFVSAIVPNQHDLDELSRLSLEERNELISRLRSDLARQNATLVDVSPPFTVPILTSVNVDGLNEQTFFGKMREVENLQIILRDTFVTFMREHGIH